MNRNSRLAYFFIFLGITIGCISYGFRNSGQYQYFLSLMSMIIGASLFDYFMKKNGASKRYILLHKMPIILIFIIVALYLSYGI